MFMKREFSLFFLMIFAAAAVFGQAVKVTPKTVVYERPKPMMDFKKEFSVTYPKISGVPRALALKIEKTISYASVMKFNLKDELGEYQWLEEATYDVGYNKRGLLGVALTLSGTGAYPSAFSKNVVADLKTGNRVTPAMVFSVLPKLAIKCREKQQAEIKEAVETIRREEPDFADSAAEMLKSSKFQVANLDWFYIDDNGVTFVYDYGFPHVAKALEPDGQYAFTWSELKPFIKRDGLLGQFIR